MLHLINLIKKHKHFLLYVIIGASGTVLNYVTYIILVKVFLVYYVVANIISVCVGITNNFILNRKYNFRLLDAPVSRYVSFFVVGLLGLLLSTSILYVLVEYVSFGKIIGKALTIPFVLVFQYSMNKNITFKSVLQQDVNMPRKDTESKHVAIIGGGILGLVASYQLLKKGYRVTILEKNPYLGGLASGIKILNTNVEKFYHHTFFSDSALICLAKELDIYKYLVWKDGSTGLYYDRKIYPFMSPFDLIKFKPLRAINRLRLGIFILYIKFIVCLNKVQEVSADVWFKRHIGEEIYNILWLPLLKGKFHEAYRSVSALWLCSRLKARSKMLGYFSGGFQILITALEDKIVALGGKINLSTEVQAIKCDTKTGKITISVGKLDREFDYAICTIPASNFINLTKGDPLVDKTYLKSLASVSYTGAVCVLFISNQSLSNYYWTNINDMESPFVVLIQHTNLVDKGLYGGKHIYYLGGYYSSSDRYFSLPEKTVIKSFYSALKRMYVDFSEDAVLDAVLVREKNAQHIVDVSFSKMAQCNTTPLKNVYLYNFAQLVGDSRNINSAVVQGINAAKQILNADEKSNTI